jgi:sugar transferase (PEP-CTERM/EpsH1 system associated)
MKILVVLPRFPYPLDKGDKPRAYHQIVELSKRHEIHLFCVSHSRVTEENIKALEPYCREIRVVRLNLLVCALNIVCNWFASKSLQMGYWNTGRSKRLCRKFATEVQPDVVYNQMVRTMPLAARLPFPKVMDFQDALSMNTERRMEQTTGFWHYVLHYEFKMLRSSEYNAFSFFDGLTIISETDSEAIPHKKNGEIRIVTNGVDTDYFNTKHLTLNTKHYSIVFTGNMAYAPNVDAACWLVKEIMPLVWKQCPYGIKVLIAGADPKPAVKALAGPKVTVSGRLDDIREAYAAASIFVAPMRIGSGMQNKLLEAMSMGLPCVTTSLAASPLGATPWEHLLVSDSAAELADLIVKLRIDELHRSIADAGHRFVQERYAWPAAVEPLESILTH